MATPSRHPQTTQPSRPLTLAGLLAAGVLVTPLLALAATKGAQTTAPAAAAPAAVPGMPRFFNYVSPPGTGDDAGEPTIGVNWTSEQVFSNSGGPIPNGGTVNYFGGFLDYMLSVIFDDCQSPARATWERKPLLTANSPRVFGDPILYVDRTTGRTFVSQLEGLTPLGSTTDITDDDGDTFRPSEGSSLPSCIDHQTFGGGPFAPPLRGVVYPNAVYYCSQCVSHAECALSLDGGVTFGPNVPIFTIADCVGLHGHVKVGPDGTVYVPNKGCGGALPFHEGGKQAVIVSEDNGLTWDIREVTTSTSNGLGQDWDPSVAIASDGTVYFAYSDMNGRAHVAVSHDKGHSWINDQDVGAQLGIKKTVWPAIVAGDPDRAAVAFYGTTTDGPIGSDTQPDFPGVWYLYVATTFDGGETWTTQNVTPGDPIQRGGICHGGDCRNMLDFFDAAIDKQGRVLVAWDDGCVEGCVSGPPNSFTAKASITRQSGGRRMFALYDPVEPRVPEAPAATARLMNGTVTLSWQVPDHGGSAITGYRVYRREGAGSFRRIARVNGTTYVDKIDPRVETVYLVTAENAQGEGPYCRTVVPDATPLPNACVVPGLVAVSDVDPGNGSDQDSGQNTPPDPSVNIRHLSLAEPFEGPGVERLTFTLQMEPGGTLAPSSQWYTIWRRRTVAPDGSDRRYVAMKTDALGALSFEYGDFGPPIPLDGSVPPPNANAPTPLVPGDDLAALNVRTFLARPEGGQRSQNNASDITVDGSYTLVGNASCFCVANQAPVARMAATPATGATPLAVAFNASASGDPDAGDAVASYTFHFGDGSEPVTQATPTISHVYAAASGTSGYFATLTVKDSKCGRQSMNVAALNIQAALGTTGVTPGDAPKAFRFAPMGNPARGQAFFTLELDRGGLVQIEAFGPDGRRVADLLDAWMPAGIHSLHWRGVDRSGKRTPAGVYIVRAKAGDRVAVVRVVLMP